MNIVRMFKAASEKADHYYWALVSLVIMNFLDAVFTLYWVEGGWATELNPVMAEALYMGPMAFILIKIGLVSLAVALLWIRRKEKIARLLVPPLTFVYCCVVTIHLLFMGNVI
jgi:hypothetical protein